MPHSLDTGGHQGLTKKTAHPLCALSPHQREKKLPSFFKKQAYIVQKVIQNYEVPYNMKCSEENEILNEMFHDFFSSEMLLELLFEYLLFSWLIS